jgi:hypothetical protein
MVSTAELSHLRSFFSFDIVKHTHYCSLLIERESGRKRKNPLSNDGAKYGPGLHYAS